MEASRPFDPKILALGRRLVESLQDEERDDPLSAWMAHHIADLMIAVESAPSCSERELLEARCMDAILKLWDHRGTVPGKSQPFAKVQEVLGFLLRIDPHSTENLFFRMRSNAPPGSLQSDWLAKAEAVDGAARILIRHCLAEAVSGDSAKLRAWIELAPQIDDGVPHSDVALAEALVRLVDEENSDIGQRVAERLPASVDNLLEELGALRNSISRDSPNCSDSIGEQPPPIAKGSDLGAARYLNPRRPVGRPRLRLSTRRRWLRRISVDTPR